MMVAAKRRAVRGSFGVERVRDGHVHIERLQRARILAAMYDVAAERGAGNVSVADVVARSGVSRRTFYEAFSGREDCFLAAFEEALGFAAERVVPAFGVGRDWCARVRGALCALLVFFDEQPLVGQLLVVESLSAGPRTLRRRGEIVALLAAAIDSGREGCANAAVLPSLTADGLVGGVLAVIAARMLQPDHPAFSELAGQLTAMIVLPYRGVAAARRELQRPSPAVIEQTLTGESSTAVVPLVDLFKGAGMRLTYRTIRVLLAIAELTERTGRAPSNRRVGEAAGMSDQGQVSKLLQRLQRAGLIDNAAVGGAGRGGANAWALTGSGRQVVRNAELHTRNGLGKRGEGEL